MKTIETERLILREFVLDDAQAVFEFGSHPEVTRYTGDAGLIQSIADARRVIVNTWHVDYRERGFGRLAVVDKATQRVIGFCGLKYLGDLQEVDLGYRLLPEFWGRGLATEAGRAVLDDGHERLGLKAIIGLILPENVASRRVLEKLGFRQAEKIKLPEAELVQVYREREGSTLLGKRG